MYVVYFTAVATARHDANGVDWRESAPPPSLTLPPPKKY